MPLTGIHFLLTYRCTHECDHCFVHGSPRARGTFTLRDLLTVLDDAVRVGTVTTVFFEGGEPFLYYQLLLAGLDAARERRFTTGAVTNAYWAETAEDARLWLEPLRDRGLASLAVSDDPFHYGERSPAPNAVAAAEALGIEAGTIRIDPDGVMLKGRAADKLADDLPGKEPATFVECPHEDLADPGRVHVDAFGHVHLCQGISMGNAFETPFSDLVREWDAKSHPICGPILEGGPAELARAHGVETADPAASACHLCYRTRQRLRERFPESLAPPGLYGA